VAERFQLPWRAALRLTDALPNFAFSSLTPPLAMPVSNGYAAWPPSARLGGESSDLGDPPGHPQREQQASTEQQTCKHDAGQCHFDIAPLETRRLVHSHGGGSSVVLLQLSGIDARRDDGARMSERVTPVRSGCTRKPSLTREPDA
jgi:hypothetical protein